MAKSEHTFKAAFGRHLRELREKRGWTQLDLSAVSQIDETQISKIEKGKVGPNLETIKALAIALGFYPKELLNFDFELKLNTNFSTHPKHVKGPSPTKFVYKLIEEDFFDLPRSVSDVRNYCEEKFGVELDSANTSGVLLKLFDAKLLKRFPASVKGKFLYQRTAKRRK